jgi:hypothetical protein
VGPDSLQTLDDKVIERLRQEMGEDASLIVESYVESVGEFLSDISNRTLLTPRPDLRIS